MADTAVQQAARQPRLSTRPARWPARRPSIPRPSWRRNLTTMLPERIFVAWPECRPRPPGYLFSVSISVWAAPAHEIRPVWHRHLRPGLRARAPDQGCKEAIASRVQEFASSIGRSVGLSPQAAMACLGSHPLKVAHSTPPCLRERLYSPPGSCRLVGSARRRHGRCRVPT